MRISDWSSDVCSSDLPAQPHQIAGDGAYALHHPDKRAGAGRDAHPDGAGRTVPGECDTTLLQRHFEFHPPSVPDDLVEPLLFLASDKAHAVHGACHADNGITAR